MAGLCRALKDQPKGLHMSTPFQKIYFCVICPVPQLNVPPNATLIVMPTCLTKTPESASAENSTNAMIFPRQTIGKWSMQRQMLCALKVRFSV